MMDPSLMRTLALKMIDRLCHIFDVFSRVLCIDWYIMRWRRDNEKFVKKKNQQIIMLKP